jgi:hypothetical protein
LLVGRKGGLEVPNEELNLVASVRERNIVEREAPFADTWERLQFVMTPCLAQPAT